MKRLRKVASCVIAMVMTLAMTNIALAANANVLKAPEDTITAEGLTPGDTIDYYQLVAWKSPEGGWELTTLGGMTGYGLSDLVDGITQAEAVQIATKLAQADKTGDMHAANENGTTTESGVAAGLYYLKAVPAAGHKDTVYNPAFVSADYTEGGNTVSFSSSYQDTAVVKKSTITFEKEVTGNDNFKDTKVGDKIPYKITTQIPSYGSSYTRPVFVVTDTFSKGLTYNNDIKVTYSDGTGSYSTETTNNYVEIVPTEDAAGFTVSFTQAYLTSLDRGEASVTITYSATVNDEAISKNVNQLTNTADLQFSNSPDINADVVHKEDKTIHYTFTIDGDILGSDGVVGSELIKTGTDAAGNAIQETKQTIHGKEVSPLSGAKFKLVGKTGTVTAGVNLLATTDDSGKIRFEGLDAGEYTLTEEEAPTGYIRDTRTFNVKITANYGDEDPVTGEKLLTSYDISITSNGYTGGAHFNITNDGNTATAIGSSIEDVSNFINNTMGTALPSTGGIGTTIFYIVGGVMVVGAVVFLLTKRRIAGNE